MNITTSPVNDNYNMYQLIEDVKRLVDENKFLIEELKSIRKTYTDYDEACSLFELEY